MRSAFGTLLGVTLFAGLVATGAARAEDTQICDVPAYLLTSDSALKSNR